MQRPLNISIISFSPFTLKCIIRQQVMVLWHTYNMLSPDAKLVIWCNLGEIQSPTQVQADYKRYKRLGVPNYD